MNKPPSRTYSVLVPTKTYLRKYLHTFYGNPIQLNYRSPLGTFILSILEKEFFDINLNNEKTGLRLSYMQDEVQFSAPFGTMTYKGHSVNPDKIIAINRYFEDLFIEDLYKYTKENLKSRLWRPGFSDAINSFCDLCGIEVEIDITFEALKKAEARHREKVKKKFQTFVPQQSRPMQMGYFGSFQGLSIT